jgi:5-(carboxyamino)imidazole ribonucleotide mutase
MASSPKNWTTDRDYYIGIFELTQSQYEKICGATTFSENKGDKKPTNGKDNKNVTYFALRGDRTVPTEKIPSVSSDTGTFFQRLNFKTGLYFDLPTDVMWEIAARAGATTVYSWGDDSITDKFEDYVVLNSIKDVGTKLPNNWGIYDTTGNADEICRGGYPPRTAKERGLKVIIAGAGMAAALPGVIAACTTLPVIGVPIKGMLDGLDAMLSIIQMPPGIPVATVGVNGAQNAAILALEMLALNDEPLAERLAAYKEGLKEKIVKANEDLSQVQYSFKTN